MCLLRLERRRQSGVSKLAKELGAKLAQEGFGLIYGGAQIGLMGQVADAALKTEEKLQA